MWQKLGLLSPVVLCYRPWWVNGPGSQVQRPETQRDRGAALVAVGPRSLWPEEGNQNMRQLVGDFW